MTKSHDRTVVSSEITAEERRRLQEVIERLSAGETIPSHRKYPIKEWILDKHNLVIAKMSIANNTTLGNTSEVPSEFAQLNGAVSPFTTLTGGGMNKKERAYGKRSVLLDMLLDNINSLPSVRGRSIYMVVPKMGSEKTIDPELNMVEKDKAKLIADLLKDEDKKKQIHLVGSALDQCYPRMRGLPDFLNPLAYVNWIFSRVSMRLERGLFTLGAFGSYLFHEARKKYSTSSGWTKVAAGIGVGFASIPHLIGQIPTLAGNVLRYTRHLVDGVSNVVSSIFAGRDKEKKYPTLKVCAKTIGKSLLYLVPTVAVLACCFIPGMQFVPVVAAVVVKFHIAAVVASWLGIGAGASLASQAVSGGLRKAIIAGRGCSTTAKLSKEGLSGSYKESLIPAASTTKPSPTNSFLNSHSATLSHRRATPNNSGHRIDDAHASPTNHS